MFTPPIIVFCIFNFDTAHQHGLQVTNSYCSLPTAHICFNDDINYYNVNLYVLRVISIQWVLCGCVRGPWLIVNQIFACYIMQVPTSHCIFCYGFSKLRPEHESSTFIQL